ncbi:MAG TPA: MFS transporter, partial [Giesbergeria sp.]|nr:MFS transporter [Giesbergeria sp.]
GGNEAQRSRIVAWREAAALVGVVLASVLSSLAGVGALVAVFAVLLAAGWLAWARAPRPALTPSAGAAMPWSALWQPWRQAAFRRLMAVFVPSGIASAIPATLVLFFIDDRLQLPANVQGAFLGAYFLSAALSMPLWLRAVPRWGLARTWLAGMLLSVAVFIGAATLGAGDAWPFLLVCVLSGLALGADLALPGALLAGVIAQDGGDARHGGAYFGWWNLAAKLNLALAAGLALPLLGLWGYAPGARSEDALLPLTLAYAVLPCALKLLAAACLYLLILRPRAAPTALVAPRSL